MIKITGVAYLRVPYVVELDMSEDEFDNLSTKKADQIIDEAIDWRDTLRNAEPNSFDIDELEETG